MTNASTRRTNGVADVPTQFVVQFINNTQRVVDQVVSMAVAGVDVDVVPAGGRSAPRNSFGVANALNGVMRAEFVKRVVVAVQFGVAA